MLYKGTMNKKQNHKRKDLLRRTDKQNPIACDDGVKSRTLTQTRLKGMVKISVSDQEKGVVAFGVMFVFTVKATRMQSEAFKRECTRLPRNLSYDYLYTLRKFYPELSHQTLSPFECLERYAKKDT